MLYTSNCMEAELFRSGDSGKGPVARRVLIRIPYRIPTYHGRVFLWSFNEAIYGRVDRQSKKCTIVTAVTCDFTVIRLMFCPIESFLAPPWALHGEGLCL